jgi:chromate reductase
MNTYPIAVIVGSLRQDSLNRRLADAIVKLAPAEFSFKQVQIGNLPLYNQDDDANPAETVKQLKAEILAARGLLFVTPEYNRSIPGVLKNAIDWCSRSPSQPWRGRVAGLLGATPGPFGTARVMPDLRKVLSSLGVLVVPSQLGIARAGEAFSPEGRLRDQGLERSLEGVVREVIETARKLG